MEPLEHVAGVNNPADIATRGEAKEQDINESSVWQCGPDWLYLEREEWKLSREFLRRVPEEELRGEVLNLNVEKDEVQEETDRAGRLESVLNYSDSRLKVKGIIARLLRATLLHDRASIREPLTPLD